MNAAVTGGTGFFGRVLLKLLRERADEVRVLVRRSEDETAMRSQGALPVRGDLTVACGCDGLVRRGDVVFHAAARVDLTGSWADFERTTVAGTRRLLDAALPQEPARFLYISSAAVYSPADARGDMSAERTPARPPRNNFYGRAKLAAENEVREACERFGCPWTIMRLGFLYGPGNRALLKHFVPLLQRGQLAVIGSGRNRIASLHVDDAARAVLLAATHTNAAGKIYDVASDETVTQQQYLDATAQALGLAPPRRRAPRSLAYLAAGLAECWARLRGCDPPFTRAMVVLMSADQVLDASRLRQELGWRPIVSFKEGMQEMQAWCRQQNDAAALQG